MNKIYFSETDDLIDIRKDDVFKAVFTKDTPASQGALSGLISTFIKRNVSIVTITANEPPIDNLRNRQIRFDINCKTENDELVNVEMSLSPDSFELIRLEFHTAKLFIGQDIRGKDRSYNDLKETYQISILAKDRFFPDEEVLHTFEYYDRKNDLSLNGRTQIITIELSKLEKIVEKPAEEMSSAERWAVFFEYLTDKEKREKINQIIKYQEGIAMASEVLIKVTRDEEEQAWLRSREKYELDTQSKMTQAKKEGRKEVIDLLKSGKSLEQIISEYENNNS